MQTPDAISHLFTPIKGHAGPVPLILAPMAGITDLPFRTLARRFGADLTVSEMIASQAMIRGVAKCLKLSEAGDQDAPLAVQIAGADPYAMAEAARMQADLGAEIIDINMGCPVKKIVSSGSGAALLQNESLAGRIMEAVVRAVEIPVTVKIRLGWDEAHLNGVTMATMAEAAGIRSLVVHGRTRAQMYSGVADWQAIGAIKRSVGIPVIGNGDIKTPQQAEEVWRQTGVDGIMIGRAALGRPWIFREITHYLNTGTLLPAPPLSEQAELMVGHFQAMLDHHGARTGQLLARKHLAWFTRGLPGGALFRDRMNHAPNPEVAFQLLADFLGQQLSSQAV